MVIYRQTTGKVAWEVTASLGDILRMAGVDQVTRKSLTGHVTDEMTEHYSSVGLDEKRAAMAAVGAKLGEAKVGPLVGTAAKKAKAA